MTVTTRTSRTGGADGRATTDWLIGATGGVVRLERLQNTGNENLLLFMLSGPGINRAAASTPRRGAFGAAP